MRGRDVSLSGFCKVEMVAWRVQTEWSRLVAASSHERQSQARLASELLYQVRQAFGQNCFYVFIVLQQILVGLESRI